MPRLTCLQLKTQIHRVTRRILLLGSGLMAPGTSLSTQWLYYEPRQMKPHAQLEVRFVDIGNLEPRLTIDGKLVNLSLQQKVGSKSSFDVVRLRPNVHEVRLTVGYTKQEEVEVEQWSRGGHYETRWVQVGITPQYTTERVWVIDSAGPYTYTKNIFVPLCSQSVRVSSQPGDYIVTVMLLSGDKDGQSICSFCCQEVPTNGNITPPLVCSSAPVH